MAPRRESGVPSARTVLEVADGLRWTDPGLGASLAEHALRLAGDDAAVRTAAERSVIRSLAEVDRFDEVVSRATPLLDDAQVRGDREDLAGLLAELAGAAIGLGDVAVAGRLVEPVRPGGDLSARTATLAGLVRAQVAAATGDIAGADRAAEEAAAALLHTPEPEAGLVRRDLARARAAARRRGGQPGSALPIVVEAVSGTPGADADGGRRSCSQRRTRSTCSSTWTGARRHSSGARPFSPPARGSARGGCRGPGPAGPGRTRPPRRRRLCRGAVARTLRRHRAGGRRSRRSRGTGLGGGGLRRREGGELGTALSAVRRGHELDSRARDDGALELRVLTMIAAAAPDLPVVADPPAGPENPQPVTNADVAPALSEVESLLADARSSAAGGVNGTDPLPRRRSHRRDDGDDDDRRAPTCEPVPDGLARLLGAPGLAPAWTEDTAPPRSDEGATDEPWGGTDGRAER